MAALEPLCKMIGVSAAKFNKRENILLEAMLFTMTSQELKIFFKNQSKVYYSLIKLEKEESMLDNLAHYIIKDILSTKEYTIEGIAYYTETPIDIIFDLAIGKIKSVSELVFRKIMELHKTIRADVYKNILKKVIDEYAKLLTH